MGLKTFVCLAPIAINYMSDLELFKRDLLNETKRGADLYDSQILRSDEIFAKSVFIELLILLNYVLQKLSIKKCRINWSDDVEITEKNKDITDLVNCLRNAACHNDSQENIVCDTGIKFVFNRFTGKCPNAMDIGGGKKLGNEYVDDLAFYYGDKRIYLIRHIKRLLEELPDRIGSTHD